MSSNNAADAAATPPHNTPNRTSLVIANAMDPPASATTSKKPDRMRHQFDSDYNKCRGNLTLMVPSPVRTAKAHKKQSGRCLAQLSFKTMPGSPRRKNHAAVSASAPAPAPSPARSPLLNGIGVIVDAVAMHDVGAPPHVVRQGQLPPSVLANVFNMSAPLTQTKAGSSAFISIMPKSSFSSTSENCLKTVGKFQMFVSRRI